jgi:hypothetical protein
MTGTAILRARDIKNRKNIFRKSSKDKKIYNTRKQSLRAKDSKNRN